MIKYTYTFKLWKRFIPDLTDTKNDTFGGIKLVYKVYKTFYFIVFKRHLKVLSIPIGKKTFLRPFKKNWDKKTYRLPPPYWGKKSAKFTRLWVMLSNDYSLKNNKVIPEATLIHQHVKLFNKTFRSKELNTFLFGHSNNREVFQLKKNSFQLSPIN